MAQNYKLTTAVGLMVFNRPERTAQIFSAIRSAQPETLLIVADGPRADRPGEAELCQQTRAVVEAVDWPCRVITNYADSNMGCRNRISSGLKWIFEEVEEAIILEDDCLPDPTFFRFCQELLTKYRDDQRIGLIGGNNFLPGGYLRYDQSYYFSRFTHIWGWASWRRAFQHYDLSMSKWPNLRLSGWLEEVFNNDRAQVAYWREKFDQTWAGIINTWDYQLTFSYWVQNFTSICPARNLVSNIGFGADATHTHEATPLANLPVYPMKFPLNHPYTMNQELFADEYSTTCVYNVPMFRPSLKSLLSYPYPGSITHYDKKSEKKEVYQAILKSALAALEAEEPLTAIKLIDICRQNGYMLRDLAYIYALCCVKLNDAVAAKESLEIELASFPDNDSAKALYAELG